VIEQVRVVLIEHAIDRLAQELALVEAWGYDRDARRLRGQGGCGWQ
jgi:hypothetical protein